MAKNKKVILPRDCLGLVRPLILDWHKEHFFGIYLSTRNTVIKVELISLGTLNASLIHPRELFRPAIIKSANQIIILHNHPSGEVEPSESDIATTERLKKVGELLGIKILDHIIFAKSKKYYSFLNDSKKL
jgi:DNA repair protein RadC